MIYCVFNYNRFWRAYLLIFKHLEKYNILIQIRFMLLYKPSSYSFAEQLTKIMLHTSFRQINNFWIFLFIFLGMVIVFEFLNEN